MNFWALPFHKKIMESNLNSGEIDLRSYCFLEDYARLKKMRRGAGDDTVGHVEVGSLPLGIASPAQNEEKHHLFYLEGGGLKSKMK